MWTLLVGCKNRGGYCMTTSDTACAPVNGLLRSLHSKRIGTWAMLALLTVFALANPRLTSAQAVYGSVFGTVTDSTGAVVPNATVTVTDVAKGTSQTALSNESGQYRVQHLISDTYTGAAGGKVVI